MAAPSPKILVALTKARYASIRIRDESEEESKERASVRNTAVDALDPLDPAYPHR